MLVFHGHHVESPHMALRASVAVVAVGISFPDGTFTDANGNFQSTRGRLDVRMFVLLLSM